jgi:hypothetical protein
MSYPRRKPARSTGPRSGREARPHRFRATQQGGDFRIWHLADIRRYSLNVRYRGRSGHCRQDAGCLPLTPSGHWSIFRRTSQNRRGGAYQRSVLCATCSVTHRRLMLAGARSRLRTRGDFRYQRFAMWISGPVQTSSRHADTTVTSKPSSRSCTSTTRATLCDAVPAMTPARARHAGPGQSPPTI